MISRPGAHFGDHICGCYIILPSSNSRQYLPQVKLDSQTRITPVNFVTKLTQTFNNASETQLAEVRYCFPLYDGVAVSAYEIKYGDKHLQGLVKQKDDAKKVYQAAVDRGETAGLLESLPAGIFGVTLGNVPAKTDIVVEITYCGELRHDAGIDGLRYILPTKIAPRYGSYPGSILNSNAAARTGISITVDLDMCTSAIRKIQSPSHPIAVTMGNISSDGEDASFVPTKGSASLTLGTTELDADFVLQVLVDDIAQPQAIIESHPILPHQRAIMATLVPKFVLPPADPEIVFIADQSGSMMGSKNQALITALRVFLKSLPLNVRFNLCAFGGRSQFLWPKSQAYNEANLENALQFINGFSADYGGTEILKPITEAFERRLAGMPLEVMLLTDGEVWGEAAVFDFINSQVQGTDNSNSSNARVFALGIGNDVSHTLVEGVARAGNGFAQFVVDEKETDQKVVRMLKGALYAHTNNYTVDIDYASATEQSTEDDRGYEFVEKVNQDGRHDDTGSAKDVSIAPKNEVISFFDESANTDGKLDKGERYAHLPKIDSPAVLQAPSVVPPLYPFSRSTIYLLLGPEAPQQLVKSITIRAESNGKHLSLTVPVHATGSSTVVHQLAARKAMQEIEEGRGWLHSARLTIEDNKQGELVREKYPDRFDEILEREAVRLGVRFQVTGKWTSFVAVEKGKDSATEHDDLPSTSQHEETAFQSNTNQSAMRFHRAAAFLPPPAVRAFSQLQDSSHQFKRGLARSRVTARSGGALASTYVADSPSLSPPTGPPMPAPMAFSNAPGGVPLGNVGIGQAQQQQPSAAGISQNNSESTTIADKMRSLVDLQKFSGHWALDSALLAILGIAQADAERFRAELQASDPRNSSLSTEESVATLLAMSWLQCNCAETKAVWDMVFDKGRTLLESQTGCSTEQIDALLNKAIAFIPVCPK